MVGGCDRRHRSVGRSAVFLVVLDADMVHCAVLCCGCWTNFLWLPTSQYRFYVWHGLSALDGPKLVAVYKTWID